MKNGIWVLCCIFSLLSCETSLKEIPQPENLIPKDKLVLILEELMIVEQHIQTKYPQINQFEDIAKRSGDAILKKYGVSYKRFDQAMDYYGSHQKEMQEIYNQILDRLNTKLNQL